METSIESMREIEVPEKKRRVDGLGDTSQGIELLGLGVFQGGHIPRGKRGIEKWKKDRPCVDLVGQSLPTPEDMRCGTKGTVVDPYETKGRGNRYRRPDMHAARGFVWEEKERKEQKAVRKKWKKKVEGRAREKVFG